MTKRHKKAGALEKTLKYGGTLLAGVSTAGLLGKYYFHENYGPISRLFGKAYSQWTDWIKFLGISADRLDYKTYGIGIAAGLAALGTGLLIGKYRKN